VVIPKGLPQSVGRVGNRLMAFHAFHTLAFPWPALEAQISKFELPKTRIYSDCVCQPTSGHIARIKCGILCVFMPSTGDLNASLSASRLQSLSSQVACSREPRFLGYIRSLPKVSLFMFESTCLA